MQFPPDHKRLGFKVLTARLKDGLMHEVCSFRVGSRVKPTVEFVKSRLAAVQPSSVHVRAEFQRLMHVDVHMQVCKFRT